MSAAVIDTEGDNLLQNITVMHCASAQNYSRPQKVDSWTVANDAWGTIDGFLEYLDTLEEIIGHNIIGFDLPMLEKLYGWKPKATVKIRDTLILSRLYNPDRRRPLGHTGRSGPHSLDAWGYRINRSKPAHEDWSVYTPAMLHRNQEDVGINVTTARMLEDEAAGHDWSQAEALENEVLRIITQQEVNGVYFNLEAAKELIYTLNQRIEAIDAELIPRLPITYRVRGVPVNRPFKANGEHSKMVLDHYPNPSDYLSVGGPFSRVDAVRLDLGSIQQVKEYLLTQGWIPIEWNFSKLTGERTSPKLTEESYGTIKGNMGELVKERITCVHRRSQVTGWLDRLRPDGRLSACANTIGTPTGRFRHSNVVNVPKAVCYPKGHPRVGQLVDYLDAEYQYVPYGTEMRSLFCVPKGFRLVGCDAEQIELRILAHYMGDALYIEEILSGDIHTYNQLLAGLPNRDAAKTFIYAFIYGAGDALLGAIVGGTSADGARLRESFLQGLPELKRLITKAKRAAKKGWLKGLDGRKLHLRRGDDGNVQTHKALNLLIQAGGAVVMKTAMVILDKMMSDENIDGKKVLDMHDEFQWEVSIKDSQRAAELMELSIVEAGKELGLKIPMAGQSKIGDNWAETH
tara:strand:- start:2113 stop:3999 length:1887 start_codon:yes stop_codon:yes gene_type:complete